MYSCLQVRRLQSTWLAAISLTLALPVFAPLGCLGAALPDIPREGKSENDFVPKGWNRHASAYGDLNGDKIDDCVMILTRGEDSPTSLNYDDSKEYCIRPLLVLHGKSDGSYTKAACSAGAIMDSRVSAAFALLILELSIENKNIIIKHANGASSAVAFESKYRMQNGRYELVGLTEWHGSLRTGISSLSDRNLNTGRANYEFRQDDPNGTKRNRNEHGSSYSLRAGLAPSVPDIENVTTDFELLGKAVNLRHRENLVSGKAVWKGPEDFSASIKAVHTKTDLFVQARVTHKNPNSGASIRLVGNKSKILPVQVKTIVLKNGEFIVARFPLAKLSKLIVEADGYVPVSYKTNKGFAYKFYKTLEASVQVVEPGVDGRPDLVLSTSCNVEKTPGSINLTKKAELPNLESWDWTQGDQYGLAATENF